MINFIPQQRESIGYILELLFFYHNKPHVNYPKLNHLSDEIYSKKHAKYLEFVIFLFYLNAMSAYIIIFEINDSIRRQNFREAIKRNFTFWCPITNNAWAIQSDKTSRVVYDILSPSILTEDRLFIIRSGTDAIWYNSFGIENDEWLKKYL